MSKKKHNNEKRQKIPRIIKLWIPKPCKKTKWVRKKTHLNQIDMHDCVYMIYFNLHLFLCRLSLFADFFFPFLSSPSFTFCFYFCFKNTFFFVSSAETANCNNIKCKDRQVCLNDLITHRPRCVSCSFKCPRRKRPQVNTTRNK